MDTFIDSQQKYYNDSFSFISTLLYRNFDFDVSIANEAVIDVANSNGVF